MTPEERSEQVCKNLLRDDEGLYSYSQMVDEFADAIAEAVACAKLVETFDRRSVLTAMGPAMAKRIRERMKP